LGEKEYEYVSQKFEGKGGGKCFAKVNQGLGFLNLNFLITLSFIYAYSMY